MDQIFIFDRAKIGAELDRFVDYAQTLTEPKELSTAIQAWDTIASVAATPPLLAQANLSLGRIYREWDELFTAQRFPRESTRSRTGRSNNSLGIRLP